MLTKRHEYLDKVPLNIVKNGTTPLDRCPSLKSLTNKLVVSAATMKLLGATDANLQEKIDNVLQESRKTYNFSTL